MEKHLPLHEWLAVAALSTLMLLLAVIAVWNRTQTLPTTSSSKSPHYLLPQEIEVTVEGAVEHSGHYKLKVGSRVKDLLEIAKPLPEANLKKIKMESQLREGRLLKVPFTEMIVVHIKGAVKQEGELKIKKGTRLVDLLEIVNFSENADLEPLQKKRRLKEQEVIEIKIKE